MSKLYWTNAGTYECSHDDCYYDGIRFYAKHCPKCGHKMTPVRDYYCGHCMEHIGTVIPDAYCTECGNKFPDPDTATPMPVLQKGMTFLTPPVVLFLVLFLFGVLVAALA